VPDALGIGHDVGMKPNERQEQVFGSGKVMAQCVRLDLCGYRNFI
jgi:hypothetical protein